MSRRLRSNLWIGAFCLTGIGTSLLGATLPATLQHWHLSDRSGGLLLLAGWGGSTSGALLARGRLDRAAAGGLALSALALFALSTRYVPHLFALYLVYGVGLGLAMTAISLLRSREVDSAKVDLDLNRLNLVWAAGACISPALALHSLRLVSVAGLYRNLGLLFAAAALAVMLVSRATRGRSLAATPAAPLPVAYAPLRFSIFAATSVGLESAIGSWLTTYAERATLVVGAAVSANLAFWFGLLLSRASHSLQSAPWLHTRRVRNLHLCLACAAVLLILAWPRARTLPFAGFLCGFGLGPLYPFVLAATLPRYRSMAIFLSAGIGSSVVPWLTGALSTATGSLRIGLLMPAATLALLVASAVRIDSQAHPDYLSS